jgi:predicted unusual protein kinase regulating ubiquinone biosynthesis (AarF/ABC1/UbiB family)
VKKKLLEETDYANELFQGETLAKECAHLENIIFPKYYKEYSSDKVLTMEWMEGEHLSEFFQRMAGTKKPIKFLKRFGTFICFNFIS